MLKSVLFSDDLQQFFFDRQERIDYEACEPYATASDNFVKHYEALQALLPEQKQMLFELDSCRGAIEREVETLAYKKGFEDAMQFCARFLVGKGS